MEIDDLSSDITKIDTGVYKLVDDIELEDTTIEKFDGILYGNGHKINTLFGFNINKLSGELKNMTISGANFIDINTGKITDCKFRESLTVQDKEFGGICRVNKGEIRDCSVDITSKTTELSGLICAKNKGKIISCDTRGTIVSNQTCGGIAGSIYPESEIKNCTSKATVKSDKIGGGIVGMEEADHEEEIIFEQCNFHGIINSYGNGGFIFGGNSKQDVIYDSCEITGNIKAPNVRAFEISEIRDCSIDVELTYQGTLIASKDIRIKDSEIEFTVRNPKEFRLKPVSYVTIHPVSTTFKITVITREKTEDTVEDILDISSTSATIHTKIKKGSSKTHYVSSEEELYECNPYDTIILKDNITLTRDKSLVTQEFYGKLHGNQYTISNSNYPLFNALLGTVSNIKIENSNIKNSTDRQNVGILTRYNLGTITDVLIKDSIVDCSYSFVGGVAGNSGDESVVKDITLKNVIVNGENDVGGVCGLISNFKDISVDNINIAGDTGLGGVAGRCVQSEQNTGVHKSCTIKNSLISGQEYTGGAIGINLGESSDFTITNTTILGKRYIGGFSGESHNDISNIRINNVSVSGKYKTGGFSGGIFSGSVTKIQNCKVDCEVTGKENVSGFISESFKSKIQGCVASGSVTGKSVVGFIETCKSTEIINSYCHNSLNGNSIAAFISELNRDSSIEKSFTVSKSTNSEVEVITEYVDENSIKSLYWSTKTLPQVLPENTIGTPIKESDIKMIKSMIL